MYICREPLKRLIIHFHSKNLKSNRQHFKKTNTYFILLKHAILRKVTDHIHLNVNDPNK